MSLVVQVRGYSSSHVAVLAQNFIKGYTLSELKETEAGLTARLLLAGSACNAFGHDIRDLTVSVAYESKTRYVAFSS
jgi:hypothetical protein